MKPRTFSWARHLRPDLGLDLGSAHTRLSSNSDGLLVDEPSLVAVDLSARASRAGVAVGHHARLLDGRTAGPVRTLRPMRHGAVADLELCEFMLRSFFRKAAPGVLRPRPRTLVAVPHALTTVERQALSNAVTRAGARDVSLIRRALAAAIALELPITEPVGSMICDLGAGTTEISIICLSGVAVSESLRVAGDDFDLAIADFLRRELRVSVATHVAERIKVELGSAMPVNTPATCEVCARDLVAGLPRRITLSSEQVSRAMDYPIRMIVDGVARALEACPPELSGDLMDHGMTLVGAGAELHGLDRRLAEATGMPVRVADEPHTAVARGLAICLGQLELWQGLMRDQRAA